VESRVAATGALLVGGASSRFGSPKALARFRRETLGERGRRVLGDVFDEVIVVGKAGDDLGLPFVTLDDDETERAPVFGVVAALRAALHETVVVLPVDCPLVGEDVLRRLAEARAVPQTVPLPGAYTKDMLRLLERRVADGELSLRGVNPATIELDERVLVNANTRLELLTAAVAEWAGERPDVRAAAVIGSQSRADTPADRWSDLDVFVLADEPRLLADDAAWLEELGRPVLTFREPAVAGDGVERRVLYESGEEVDFAIFAASDWPGLVDVPGLAAVIARGSRVLYDDLGVEAVLGRVAARPSGGLPDEAAFTELANDFWYHALWTAKKLRRGEILTALGCLVEMLLAKTATLLGWHARAVDPSADTWHGTRFVERWADPGALASLESAFPHYEIRDIARGLWQTVDLWEGLELETARRLGFASDLDHADLRRRLADVVPDPRRGSTL
jgi:aminoglycoside 6-adenylyltransferase